MTTPAAAAREAERMAMRLSSRRAAAMVAAVVFAASAAPIPNAEAQTRPAEEAPFSGYGRTSEEAPFVGAGRTSDLAPFDAAFEGGAGPDGAEPGAGAPTLTPIAPGGGRIAEDAPFDREETVAAPPPGPIGPSPETAELVASIEAVGAEWGTGAWDGAVRTLLLGAYDDDRSGALDAPREITSISCDVWAALDAEDAPGRAQFSATLLTLYGFDGASWIGYLLGVDGSQRETALGVAQACGLRR